MLEDKPREHGPRRNARARAWRSLAATTARCVADSKAGSKRGTPRRALRAALRPAESDGHWWPGLGVGSGKRRIRGNPPIRPSRRIRIPGSQPSSWASPMSSPSGPRM
jgi:hypothetical protein